MMGMGFSRRSKVRAVAQAVVNVTVTPVGRGGTAPIRTTALVNSPTLVSAAGPGPAPLITSSTVLGPSVHTGVSVTPTTIATTSAVGSVTVPEADPYVASSFYATGNQVLYDGKTWQATLPVARYHAPQGIGDGSTEDRVLLLYERRGYAASVTGGYLGATYTVTNTNDSGTGSLREALTASNDPLWIIFDKTIFAPANATVPTLINLLSVCRMRPNKTIDGRGVRVGIGLHETTVAAAAAAGANPKPLRFDGNQGFGTTANIILAYFDIEHAGTADSDNVPTVVNGGDLFWTHHVTLTDCPDSMHTLVDNKGNVSRYTSTWDRIHDQPGFAMDQLTDNRRNGRGVHCGLSPQDATNPLAARMSIDHLLLERVYQRGPLCLRSLLRMTNSKNYHWGHSSITGGYAARCSQDGQLWISNCIFDQPNTARSVNAIRQLSDNDGTPPNNGWLRQENNTFRPSTGLTVNANNYTSRPSPGFFSVAPPNDITLLTADSNLDEDLLRGAGNKQPWALVQ